MKCEQRGWALVSFAGELPMVHSFHLPEWEAGHAKQAAQALPPHLRDRLQVVPAVLNFTADAGIAVKYRCDFCQALFAQADEAHQCNGKRYQPCNVLMRLATGHAVTCKLFPDSFDEREPIGPCTCGFTAPIPAGGAGAALEGEER
jgi:hypothetical protein